MKSLRLLFLVVLPAALFAETVDVNVHHGPQYTSTNKYKLESTWQPCRYCGSKTNYERKYEWDVYGQKWVDITKKEDIPDVCRHCRQKMKGREKRSRVENDLDRQIEDEQTKIRIKKKKKQLETLRQKAR